MKHDFSKYILPVNDPCSGSGVLVGNYFITAGHVVAGQDDQTICYDGKKYPLDEAHRLHFSAVDDNNWKADDDDIAIYQFEGIDSPVEITNMDFKAGDVVESKSQLVVVVENNDENVPAFLRTSDHLELVECTGVVKETEGNFVLCEMSYPLKKGSSGSPVLVDGKLVGILSGGVPGTNKCVFQKISTVEF